MAAISNVTLVRRALARRCPLCGRGAIFRSHFKMNRSCLACHAVFWKDPGEALGAMYLDYAVAVACCIVSWPIVDFATGLSEPVQLALLAAVTTCSVLVFYPLTRSFWTLLVYLSGGIERPPMRLIGGRKDA